jgi:aryl-alcohol dehydrogenase-like predicted oxidoreductase
MAVIPWGPLSGGWLSGRWRKGAASIYSSRSGRLPARYDLTRPANQHRLEVVEELALLAEDAGITLLHLALAFVLNHPAVTSVIVGPRTMDHFEGQIGAVDVRLDADVLDRIDKLVRPGTDLNRGDTGYAPPALLDASLRRRAG